MRTEEQRISKKLSISVGQRTIEILNVPYLQTYWSERNDVIKRGIHIPLEEKISPQAVAAIKSLYQQLEYIEKTNDQNVKKVYDTYRFIDVRGSSLVLEPIEILTLEIEKAFEEYLFACETYCLMGCCDFDALEFSESNTLLFKEQNPLFFEIAREQAKNFVQLIGQFVAEKDHPCIEEKRVIGFSHKGGEALEKFEEISAVLEKCAKSD